MSAYLRVGSLRGRAAPGMRELDEVELAGTLSQRSFETARTCEGRSSSETLDDKRKMGMLSFSRMWWSCCSGGGRRLSDCGLKFI